MKKQLLSLTLLYAIPVMPSVAPQPPVTEPIPAPEITDQDVIAAVTEAEYSAHNQVLKEILPLIVALQNDFQWAAMSEQDRALIIASLVALARKGKLNRHNFVQQSSLIASEIAGRQDYRRAANFFREPAPSKYRNSRIRGLQNDIKREGLHGYTIAPYMGKQADQRFQQITSHSDYDRYRI